MARLYRDVLTAQVNRKGVLDIDTVKGCSAGMAVRPGHGCYDACYAAATARFRGIDFGTSVVRKVHNAGHALEIERAVKTAPYGFFRIGTMGDPCHAWEHTVGIVEWLAPHAIPVVVTKHWRKASDEQLRRLVACGTVLNTSVSALDTPAELAHREVQMERYGRIGGVSVARVVSCDFNDATAKGKELASVQSRLFSFPHVIDNPLRVSSAHPLVRAGLIRLRSLRDLTAVRTISVARPDAYVGHCGPCPDKCGLVFCGAAHPRPLSPQGELFN